MTVVYLLAALALILVSAELFTNGVEWFGRRFELGEGAVGSVLAAVGTALPETLIPIIAILFTHAADSKDIGIGAILGAPFMLSSLTMVVTGGAVVRLLPGAAGAPLDFTINEPVLRRDLSFFVVAYACAMIAGALPFHHVKWILSPCLLVAYGVYVWRTVRGGGQLEGETKPLYFHRHPVMPHRRRIIAQVVVATLGIIIGARVFVAGVQHVSATLGLDPLLVSLILSPLATELPEKFNSVIWVRQGKDTLALGNITGRDGVPEHVPGVDRADLHDLAAHAHGAGERRPRPDLGHRLLPAAPHQAQADVVHAGRGGVDVRALPDLRDLHRQGLSARRRQGAPAEGGASRRRERYFVTQMVTVLPGAAVAPPLGDWS